MADYHMQTVVPLFIILLCFNTFQIYHTKDIPNCNYEDTVDLTNAILLTNGSYQTDMGYIIDRELTGFYDYEEIFDGKRQTVAKHLRGCLCTKGKRCIKFCCHPTKELIVNDTRQCSTEAVKDTLSYEPYIKLTYENGTRLKTHITKDMTVIQGVPCEYAYHLIPQQEEGDGWDLYENGSLYRHYDGKFLTKRDYCFMPHQLQGAEDGESESSTVANMGEWVLNPMNCPTKDEPTISNYINSVGMVISIPFIILTILVYLLIPELRNLHGKCLISYLSAMAVGYTILCTITLSNVIFPDIICNCLGYFGYYFFISAFFWLSVISFDLWQNFRLTGPIRIGQRKRFHIYSLYAWGVPACLTAIVAIVQNSDVDYYYKPGIGDDYCWLKTRDWSAMIYFYGICLVIILLDTAFFVMTIQKILLIQREIKRAMNNDSSEKNRHLRLHKNNVGLFFRLLLIMGISWLLDIFSYIELVIHPQMQNPIYYLSDFMNAIQGLMIFIFFVLKPKVLKLLKRSFKRKFLGLEEPRDNTDSDYSDDDVIALEERGKIDALQFIN